MDDIPSLPSPRLDIRDLRVVLALASERTTAQAAHVLHLTQPAVSRALLAAEDKLGTRLFERTPRGLVPTAAGERLISGATRILVELGDLEHRVATPESAPMRLRLVCECYTAYHWLPSTLANLRKSLPSLEVSLALDHTQAPVPALEAGDIDVALVTSAAVPRSRLRERQIFSDEVVFIVAANHPLAARKALTREDLCEHTLLTATVPSDEGHWFMTRVFGRARPQLRFEKIPLTEAIIDVARAGLGIAVLSEWIASPHLGKGDVVARRLASGPLLRPWRLAWRREVEGPALRLLSALEATAPRSLLAG